MKMPGKRWAILRLMTVVGIVALMGVGARADGTKSGEQQLINLDVRDAPVDQVLRMLAKAADVNIIIGQDVKGTVEAITLKDVTVETALKLIARSLGFYWYKEDNVYFVTAQPPVGTASPAGGTGGSGAAAPGAGAGNGGTVAGGNVAATGAAAGGGGAPTPAAPTTVTPFPTPPPLETPKAEPKIVVAMIPLKHVDAAEMAILFGGTVADGGGPTSRFPLASRGDLRRSMGRGGRYVQSDVFGLSFGTPGRGTRNGLGQEPVGGVGGFGGRGGRIGGAGGVGGIGGVGGAGGIGGVGGGVGGRVGGVGGGGTLTSMLPGDMEPPLAFLPQNALLVRGSQEDIDRFREILDMLDKPAKQVEIATKFVNVQTTAAKALGIDWAISNGELEFFNQGFAPGEAVNNVIRYAHGRFTAQLNALLQSGRATVINEPHIVTANNQFATIEFTTSIPYFTATISYNQFGTREVDFTSDFVDVTNSLWVVPRINADDSITVYLEPVLEDNIGEVEGPNGERIPIVTSQYLSTQVRVADGESVVLGGLIRKNEATTLRETPLLSRIPIIGPLFQARRKTMDNSELLVFVTPRIIRDVPKQ